MSKEKFNKELIIQSFLGELDSSDEAKLKLWINSHPANSKRYDDWKGQWESGEMITPWEQIDLEKNWTQILTKSEKRKKPVIPYITLLKYASAAAVLILLGIWWLGQSSITTLTNDGKGVLSYELPDRSKVWLKPGTSLQYNESEFKESRFLELSGEGFFEVQKSQVPFILKVGDASIEVLGTVFNARNNGAEVDVTLIEGSVKFNSEKNETILMPGHHAVYDDQKISKSQTFDENRIGWKTGVFSFSNTSISEVAELIAPYYGVDITVAPAKKDLTLTASFNQLELEELIPELNYILDLDIKKENETLILQ